jgi:hypothetical protein
MNLAKLWSDACMEDANKAVSIAWEKGDAEQFGVVIKRIYNIRKLFCMTRVLVLGKTRLKPKF